MSTWLQSRSWSWRLLCIMIISMVLLLAIGVIANDGDSNVNGLSPSEQAELEELETLIALQKRRVELLQKGGRTSSSSATTRSSSSSSSSSSKPSSTHHTSSSSSNTASECRDGICRSITTNCNDGLCTTTSYPSSSSIDGNAPVSSSSYASSSSQPSSSAPSSSSLSPPSASGNDDDDNASHGSHHALLSSRASLSLGSRSVHSEHAVDPTILSGVTAATGLSLRLPGRKAKAGGDASRRRRSVAGLHHHGGSNIAISLAIVAQSMTTKSASIIRFFDVDPMHGASSAPIHEHMIPSCTRITHMAATPGADNFIMAACDNGRVYGIHVVGWLEDAGVPRLRVALEFDADSIPAYESTWDHDGPHGGVRYASSSVSADDTNNVANIAPVVALGVYQKQRSILFVAAYEAGLVRVLARNGTEMYRVHAATGGRSATIDTIPSHHIRSIAINHHIVHLSPVAVVTDGGISFMKLTRAQSWLEHMCGVEDVTAIAFDQTNTHLLYAAISSPSSPSHMGNSRVQVIDTSQQPCTVRQSLRIDSLAPLAITTLKGYLLVTSPTFIMVFNTSQSQMDAISFVTQSSFRGDSLSSSATMMIAGINGNPGVTLSKEHAGQGVAPSFVITWRRHTLTSVGDVVDVISQVRVYQSYLPFQEIDRVSIVNWLRTPLFIGSIILIVLFQVYKRKQRRTTGDLARELADPLFMKQLERFNQGGGLSTSAVSKRIAAARNQRLGLTGVSGPTASGLSSLMGSSGSFGSRHSNGSSGTNSRNTSLSSGMRPAGDRASRLRDALARSVARRQPVTSCTVTNDEQLGRHTHDRPGRARYSWHDVHEAEEDDDDQHSDDEQRHQRVQPIQRPRHTNRATINDDDGNDAQHSERAGLAASDADEYDEADDGYDIPRVKRTQHQAPLTTMSSAAIASASVQPVSTSSITKSLQSPPSLPSSSAVNRRRSFDHNDHIDGDNDDDDLQPNDLTPAIAPSSLSSSSVTNDATAANQ